MNFAGGINRRRFERVPLALDWGKAQSIVGAEWHWQNHEMAQIFDMSYQGIAVAQSALEPVVQGAVVRGELILGTQDRLQLSARVAWTKGNAVGLELKEIALAARQAIEKFLKDKLIGRHMRRVEPRFFLETADFSVWYHGPGDTNLYLWSNDKGQVHRAEVEIGGALLRFERGQVSPAGDWVLQKRVIALLSQISDPHATIKELVTALSKGMS